MSLRVLHTLSLRFYINKIRTTPTGLSCAHYFESLLQIYEEQLQYPHIAGCSKLRVLGQYDFFLLSKEHDNLCFWTSLFLSLWSIHGRLSIDSRILIIFMSCGSCICFKQQCRVSSIGSIDSIGMHSRCHRTLTAFGEMSARDQGRTSLHLACACACMSCSS